MRARAPSSTEAGRRHGAARAAVASLVVFVLGGLASCAGCEGVDRRPFEAATSAVPDASPPPTPPLEGGAPLQLMRRVARPPGADRLRLHRLSGLRRLVLERGLHGDLLLNPTDRPARMKLKDVTVSRLDLDPSARLVSTTLTQEPGYVSVQGEASCLRGLRWQSRSFRGHWANFRSRRIGGTVRSLRSSTRAMGTGTTSRTSLRFA